MGRLLPFVRPASSRPRGSPPSRKCHMRGCRATRYAALTAQARQRPCRRPHPLPDLDFLPGHHATKRARVTISSFSKNSRRRPRRAHPDSRQKANLPTTRPSGAGAAASFPTQVCFKLRSSASTASGRTSPSKRIGSGSAPASRSCGVTQKLHPRTLSPPLPLPPHHRAKGSILSIARSLALSVFQLKTTPLQWDPTSRSMRPPSPRCKRVNGR